MTGAATPTMGPLPLLISSAMSLPIAANMEAHIALFFLEVQPRPRVAQRNQRARNKGGDLRSR